jgi:hypothetical protein
MGYLKTLARLIVFASGWRNVVLVRFFLASRPQTRPYGGAKMPGT